MQTQAQSQISGQGPGQAAGQLASVVQENVNSLQSHGSSMGGWRRTWQQTDADYQIRRLIVERISILFQKHRPQPSLEWQQKLPNLVKRLEESLYWDAASKEEYVDLSTLNQRLQAMAKRIQTPRNSQNYAPHGMNAVPSSSIGPMITTPGMPTMIPTVANDNTMIPTPGSDITMVPTPGSSNMISNPGGFGNMLASNSGGAPLQSHGMASTGNISNMVPTPGLNSNLYSTPLDPTASMPGSSLASQQGMGAMSLGQNAQMMANMGKLGVVNQMVPTPGLKPTQTIGVSSNSSTGMAFSNTDTGAAVQLQHQQFNAGSGGHIYRNINGQPGGNIPTNMQRKNPSFGFANGGIGSRLQLMGNGQQRMNGNTNFSNAPGYMNPTQFVHVQTQSQQHMNQQRQQLGMKSTMSGQITPLGGDGYAMNAADLAGAAGFFNPVSSAGVSASNFNMVSLGLQTSKMIPVPGLTSQQLNLQSQQQLQPPGSQALDQSQPMNFHQVSSGLAISQQQQQQQQIPKARGLSQGQLPLKLYGQNQTSVGLQHEGSQQLPASVSLVPQPLPEQKQHPQLVQHHHHHHQQEVEQEQQQQQQQIQEIQQTQQQLRQLEAQKQPQLNPVSHKELQGQQLTTIEPQVPQDIFMQKQQELQQQKLQQQRIGQQQQESHQKPHQQVLSQEYARQPQPPLQLLMNDPILTGQATSRTETASNLTPAPYANVEGQRAQQYVKQQRWLLFLRHASKCTAPEGQCHTTPHCHTARQLWGHITKCTDRDCQYARCNASRTLLKHHQQCRDANCPVCGPVRQILVQQRALAASAQAGHSSASLAVANVASITGNQPSASAGASVESSAIKSGAMLKNTTQVQPPPAKRAKIEPSQQLEMQQNCSSGAVKNETSLQVPPQTKTVAPLPLAIKSETPNPTVKTEGVGSVNAPLKPDAMVSLQLNATGQKLVQETSNQVEVDPGLKQEHSAVSVKTEPSVTEINKGSVQVKQEVIASASPTTGPDVSTNAKCSKPKIKGVSLTELFTPEQVREHITGLRQWVGQSKAKAEKNQAMEHHMSENSCQLCAVEKLTFEPPPIYCTPCGARIKRNAYWTMGSGETRHYFCNPCYSEIRNDSFELDGSTFPKSRLEKRKADEPIEEAWVQCDKCEMWQHQVCALFNGRRNEGGQAEYTCPYCYIAEIERGERKPLPQSAVLGAKDLPRTLLSDHIEQRLARRLRQERLERAQAQGKIYDEVPGADSLVIRVVSSIDKKLEVKQRFLEIFQEEDYPTEFPYKSRVLLLFQKIEGVEVCLFGMYVQEYGAECAQPNHRRVYLSYLDSVKYFRPDVKTVNGEALRTFVYHEILIGYLDYCKRWGLTSCYIWACPPLKGEDYILYCHPEIQKTPKSDKLREWYLTMLRKAINENIVLEITNLYDHFFTCIGESKAKVTAARLPYFDGDYWPGAAEDMIMQLQQEEEDGRKLQKKGKTKKTVTKRSSKAAAQAELASNASKDLQLMHKLGESICPMKEDFIMVHLQYACTHCCNFIVSGNCWVCKQCKNFHICDRCNEAEQKLEDRDRHPLNIKEAHQLFSVQVNDLPSDSKDTDEIMESEFFDNRQAFLSLCQGNHYQYDTLRRAKHSSMMVLYHLHNPTAPAFVTTCHMCHNDIETGQGWRCETCPDFDICNTCYQKDISAKHPHKFLPHPSLAEREAQNKEARQQRVLQLRKMLDLLVHASQCCCAKCQYPNCRRVKGLFRHGMNCKTRASGGCLLCKKMWYLLQLHARACKESECRVPRCKDLKEHLRRLQQQQESRRRAAVMEMMRQRAAEASGSTS